MDRKIFGPINILTDKYFRLISIWAELYHHFTLLGSFLLFCANLANLVFCLHPKGFFATPGWSDQMIRNLLSPFVLYAPKGSIKWLLEQPFRWCSGDVVIGILLAITTTSIIIIDLALVILIGKKIPKKDLMTTYIKSSRQVLGCFQRHNAREGWDWEFMVTLCRKLSDIQTGAWLMWPLQSLYWFHTIMLFCAIQIQYNATTIQSNRIESNATPRHLERLQNPSHRLYLTRECPHALCRKYMGSS